MEYKCPYCKEGVGELEDLGDSPYFLTGECMECNRQFSVETYHEYYYDEKGNKITEGVSA